MLPPIHLTVRNLLFVACIDYIGKWFNDLAAINESNNRTQEGQYFNNS